MLGRLVVSVAYYCVNYDYYVVNICEAMWYGFSLEILWGIFNTSTVVPFTYGYSKRSIFSGAPKNFFANFFALSCMLLFHPSSFEIFNNVPYCSSDFCIDNARVTRALCIKKLMLLARHVFRNNFCVLGQ
jgi:hypothetical protein